MQSNNTDKYRRESRARDRSTDERMKSVANDLSKSALHVALKSSSLLLWVPYILAAVYVAWCASFVVLSSDVYGFYQHLIARNEFNASNVTHERSNEPYLLFEPLSPEHSSSSSPSSSSSFYNHWYSSFAPLSSSLIDNSQRELAQMYNWLLLPLLTSPTTESLRKWYEMVYSQFHQATPLSLISSPSPDDVAQWCTFD